MKTTDQNQALRTELKKVLEGCEQELIQLCLLDQTTETKDDFKSSVIRYIWLKLNHRLTRHAQFLGKGLRF